METTIQSARILYTAKTRTTGGREHGVAKSNDGYLDIHLSTPGAGGTGTNPEQLFAAGWSACFEGALGVAANKMHLVFPENPVIDAEVNLCLDKTGLFLQARLNISIPGIDRTVAQELVDAASHTCPYSKAIHGNVNAEYVLI